MKEQAIQYKIQKRFEQQGWYCVKITVCNKNGFPDLMLLKDGKAMFIEVKSKNGKLSKLQEYRIKQLEEMGFECYVLNE